MFSHILTHGVAMIVRRAKGVLSHHPTWWENHKIQIRRSRNRTRRRQNREYGWVWVIEAHCVHGIEARKVISIGRVVAVPCDHIEWRGCKLTLPDLTAEFAPQHDTFVFVLITRHWRLKISLIGKTVSTDGPSIGEGVVSSIILTYVTPSLFLLELDPKT